MEGCRTPHGQRAGYVLTQVLENDRGESYVLKKFGSACWARTSDPLINSQLLYQLS